MRAGTSERRSLAALVLLSLALRAYPLHVPYIHPDQEYVPRLVIKSIVERNWHPDPAPFVRAPYPSGYLYTLRVGYLAAYGVGRAFGRFSDRIDLLASFIERPFPFLLLGRALSCLLGAATVVVTARFGRALFGPLAGLLAGLFLAVSFLHVRESHYGSLDIPATLFATAALLGVETARRGGALRALISAAALLGVATAYRYQIGAMAMVLAAAELLAEHRRRLGRIGLRLACASLAGLLAFAVLSPYTLLELPGTSRQVGHELALAYGFPGPRPLPLPTLLACGAGSIVVLLAALGLLAALRSQPKGTLAVLAGAVPFALGVGFAGRLYARYTVPLLPVVAVFAARGVETLAGLVPRRARGLAVVLLATIAVADPLARSLTLDRILGREDTRVAARRWIVDHVPAGETVLVPAPGWFSIPELPPADDEIERRWGKTLAKEVAARRRGRMVSYPIRWYGFDGAAFDFAHPAGRWVITSEHPRLPMFGLVPERLGAFLAGHATPVARFNGFDEASAGTALFEPTDANYLPLRGLAAVRQPGPEIIVWKLGSSATDGE